MLLQIADLSLPVAVCEPVTDMQRRGDFLEYVELLHEVHHLKNTLSENSAPGFPTLTSSSFAGKL